MGHCSTRYWIRTNGLLFRRQLLYPTELNGHFKCEEDFYLFHIFYIYYIIFFWKSNFYMFSSFMNLLCPRYQVKLFSGQSVAYSSMDSKFLPHSSQIISKVSCAILFISFLIFYKCSLVELNHWLFLKRELFYH